MIAPDVAAPGAWADACLAATLFAVDPFGTGGVELRALPGPVRDSWLALVRELLPQYAPLRRVPLHVTDGRLLGGLDLAATLQAGRPVAERGILAEADGGAVLLAMAERTPLATAARIAAVLDAGEVCVERDGMASRNSARVGVVALDEGMADDERVPAALHDRLAFAVDLSAIALDDAVAGLASSGAVVAARAQLSTVIVDDEFVAAFCATAMALGIASIRAPLLALKVARAAAAFAGRDVVTEADAILAGRLVLAPRAAMLPAVSSSMPEENLNDAAPPATARDAPGNDAAEESPAAAERALEDIVLEAAQAAIPAGLLAQLGIAGHGPRRSQSTGRTGAFQISTRRGRPIGTRRGEPRGGARLNVLETLRAAAPWQPLRRRESASVQPDRGRRARIAVRRDDFRVTRFRQRAETTTIFVVDASGSAALHRLAEAKGAVELLLADCYVRRDRVALIAFRGSGAELLLPPTRSLARAKRSLAGLPGGGGTPLAAGIDTAVDLADVLLRKGETPTVVFLTDGGANIARDGGAGRKRAEDEALMSARRVRAARFTVLFVDTSQHAQRRAQRLAAEMNAHYIALPYAGASAISRAVLATAR